VQAYSANNDRTPRYGFVKLNADPVWQGSWLGTHPNLRGVNVILVDPFRCSLQESRRFDTHVGSNAATQLSNYLLQVSRGNIIVGVTADEPAEGLASALPTLREMGADVAGVQRRASFGFVAQRGYPAKTVLRKVLTEARSNANPAHFNVTVTGAIYCRVRHGQILVRSACIVFPYTLVFIPSLVFIHPNNPEINYKVHLQSAQTTLFPSEISNPRMVPVTFDINITQASYQ